MSRPVEVALGRTSRRHAQLLDHAERHCAADLTAAEAAASRRASGRQVGQARPACEHLATYRGPKFIGADKIWDGTATPSHLGTRGQGIVVGDPRRRHQFDASVVCQRSDLRVHAPPIASWSRSIAAPAPAASATAPIRKRIRASAMACIPPAPSPATPSTTRSTRRRHCPTASRCRAWRRARRSTSTKSAQPIPAAAQTSSPASRTRSPTAST